MAIRFNHYTCLSINVQSGMQRITVVVFLLLMNLCVCLKCPSKAHGIKQGLQNFHAYRLGDIVLQNGKEQFDTLRQCTKKLHHRTLGSKFLNHKEYINTSNTTYNIIILNKVMQEYCKSIYNGPIPDTVIHLRLGDAVYSPDKFSRLRRPMPLRCFKQLNITNNSTIGFVYNHTAASHADVSDKVYSDGLRDLEKYLNRLYNMFPFAKYFLPHDAPDTHLCSMVDANNFVVSTGKYINTLMYIVYSNKYIYIIY